MKRRYLQNATALLTAWVLFLPTASRADESHASTPEGKTKGYRCVFMGHSFFYPIAEGFGPVAVASGFPEHTQLVRKAGGTTGTPGWLWANVPKNEEVWRTLAADKTDILAFTWHIKYCELDDYSKWIDYARKRNPGITVAIGIPWPDQFDENPKVFAARYNMIEAAVHRLVDALRKKYPGNAIFVIPHGKGVVELYRRFKAGELNEVKTLLAQSGDALFRDRGGHAGKMPVALSQLIFLAAIYPIDVRKCKWETGYAVDLKQIAYDIVKNDPYAHISRGMQAAADQPSGDSQHN